MKKIGMLLLVLCLTVSLFAAGGKEAAAKQQEIRVY
jgi:hypothetical protein